MAKEQTYEERLSSYRKAEIDHFTRMWSIGNHDFYPQIQETVLQMLYMIKVVCPDMEVSEAYKYLEAFKDELVDIDSRLYQAYLKELKDTI